MATFTALQADPLFPVYNPAGGRAMACAFGTIAVTAAPVAADIYRMCRVPAGATVVHGWFMAQDIDTGTGVMEIDVGWQASASEVADPDGFGDTGAMNGTLVANYLPVAGTLRPFAGVLLVDGPKTFASETVLALTTVVAPNAFTAGRMTLCAYYLTP